MACGMHGKERWKEVIDRGESMMKFQTSRKVLIILCLFQLLMILKWNVGRLYLQEATGDLVKGFGPLIHKYCFKGTDGQRVGSSTRNQRVTGPSCRLHLRSWLGSIFLAIHTAPLPHENEQPEKRRRTFSSRNFRTQIFLEAFGYPKALIGTCPKTLEKYRNIIRQEPPKPWMLRKKCSKELSLLIPAWLGRSRRGSGSCPGGNLGSRMFDEYWQYWVVHSQLTAPFAIGTGTPMG